MKITLQKILLTSIAIGAAASQQASAALMFDLRATALDGVPILAGPGQKLVFPTVGQNVTVEVFSIVSGVAANAATEGFQSFLSGDILSDNNGAVKGDFQNPTLIPGFDSGAPSVGALADLDGDGDIDLGSNNLTFVQGQHITVRSASVTIGNADGLTPSEFRLFTVTFHVTQVANPGAALNLTFRLTNLTAPTNFEAIWRVDGATVQTNNPTTGIGFSQIAPIPEPSAFGMVLLGAIGIVGFRRVGFRQA